MIKHFIFCTGDHTAKLAVRPYNATDILCADRPINKNLLNSRAFTKIPSVVKKTVLIPWGRRFAQCQELKTFIGILLLFNANKASHFG